MLDFSFTELIAVVVIAIVVWGKDLPAVARKLAAFYAKIRRQLTDIKDEIQREIPDEELQDITNPPPEPPGEGFDHEDFAKPPTDLEASAEHDQVFLTWSPSDEAISYNVKRATTSGGPYETIASDVYECSYTDFEVPGDGTYYYVVSSVGSGNESLDSSEVSAEIALGTGVVEDEGAVPEAGTSEQESG